MAEETNPKSEEAESEYPRRIEPHARRMRFIGFDSRDPGNYDREVRNEYDQQEGNYDGNPQSIYEYERGEARSEQREKSGSYRHQDNPRSRRGVPGSYYDNPRMGYPPYRVEGNEGPQMHYGHAQPYHYHQHQPEETQYRYRPYRRRENSGHQEHQEYQNHHEPYPHRRHVPHEYDYGYSHFYQYPPMGNPGHNPGGTGGGEQSQRKGSQMSEGINTDKVIVNTGGGGGDGAGGMAALVAALGNRNSGGDMAALVAALGNRNSDGAGMWPAMMAANGGFGNNGINGILPLILLAGLFGGRGRGGLFGGEGDGCGAEIVLSKLGSIEGAVPLAAANVQNAICNATGEITNTINQTGLAQLAATAGVKDSVQNGTTALLQAGSNNTQSILSAICTLSSKMDQNQINDLQRQLGVSQLSHLEDRLRHHSDGVEVRVNQNVNQQQQQQQQIRIEDDRFNRLFNALAIFGNQVMAARQGQDVINFGGTMTASGTQAAANTQVR